MSLITEYAPTQRLPRITRKLPVIRALPTQFIAPFDIVGTATYVLPIVSIKIARPVRPMLLAWLQACCERNGGACYGTLDVLQRESGIAFSLEDIRTLARYGYINEPLVCEDGESVPYIFVAWEERA